MTLQDVLVLHVAEAVRGLASEDSAIFLLLNIHVFINVRNFLVTNLTAHFIVDSQLMSLHVCILCESFSTQVAGWSPPINSI